MKHDKTWTLVYKKGIWKNILKIIVSDS